MAAFGIEAVIHVVVDQGLLGIAHGAFYSLKLLCHVHARASLFDHGNDGTQMALGAFQARYDFGVACVMVRFYHTSTVSSLGGCGKQGKDP